MIHRLRQHLELQDTLGIPYSNLRDKFNLNPHAKATAIKGLLSDAQWNDYFKFTAERNP